MTYCNPFSISVEKIFGFTVSAVINELEERDYLYVEFVTEGINSELIELDGVYNGCVVDIEVSVFVTQDGLGELVERNHSAEVRIIETNGSALSLHDSQQKRLDQKAKEMITISPIGVYSKKIKELI